jgi:predicted nucleotidyltransferase
LKPKDRDFIETAEGLLFCVVGYLHPPDRFTAYLKYIPSNDGKWSRGETRYKRTIPYYGVTQVENTYAYLKENYPEFIFDCPIRNITVSSVPLEKVKTYYRPEKRVKNLLKEGASDPLEQKLLDLIDLFRDRTRKKISFGVTGSILTESHNPKFSDLDITVYGLKESMEVRQALNQMMENEKSIKPQHPEKKKEWLEKRSQRFPLSKDDLEKIYDNHWNYGLFKGTYFSIHPTRKDNEIIETYGDNTYIQKGEVQGTAKISDASESIFLPSIYTVNDSTLDKDFPEISRVISYEVLFCSVFEERDKIHFKGNLEHVTGKEDFYQVVIGGAGSKSGFMKWV